MSGPPAEQIRPAATSDRLRCCCRWHTAITNYKSLTFRAGLHSRTQQGTANADIPIFFNPAVRLPLLATRQLEAADAGLPACCAGNLAGERVVLVYVPERAVVSGIDRYVRIVAPA